ncbi:hypothetical protein GLOTRDRAFT_114428 [Gloeophyllum trabeum ATCC 11539]|uniref:TFG box profile domain-containing protein n=1 Tax=Gloeophyllum trabeum (strain ATCC 11539 / FP-39264 / Madison 617) TaxID=670483 RepID=S7QD58_GLOTA|nr:uncharacterized protein GLOTRDRAFT_114428 [Gloeophyllum trabeum ATCC 11539]EPQ57791.1 hypothetical protein GLOTRDRAFT_114428 [Gloeophyllum trabeum ATCC 11539]
MALSFIGKPISLISHSDVRYRGILAGIDPAASTIQLSNVYSMGTESRRPPSEFIPPVQDPYQYIIFRASEVKDLSVDETPPPQARRSVHDDPAVLGVSAPAPIPPAAYPQYPSGPGAPQYPPGGVTQPPVPQQQPQPQPAAPQPSYNRTTSGTGSEASPSRTQSANRRGHHAAGSVLNATASLESVERALGDLRVSGANGSGRGRGRGRQDVKPVTVPPTDFDFESSNARFDKAALSPKAPTPGESEQNSENAKEGEGAEGEKKESAPAYNPKASFFDTLSSSASDRTGGRGGRGGGRRGGPGGRSRREEEREKNVATFGEPGGVGLMGPGAYVGGWGGYGRRGGGRGRRAPPVAGAGVGR